MDDRKMLEKIAGSAQHLPVPKELEPERMKKRLGRTRWKAAYRYRTIAAAACLCICFSAAGLVYHNYGKQAQSSLVQTDRNGASGSKKDHKDAASNGNQDERIMAGSAVDDSIGEDGIAEDTAAEPAGTARQNVAKKPVKRLGKIYTLASDYGAVYDVLKEAGVWQIQQKQAQREYMAVDDVAEDAALSAGTVVNNQKAEASADKDLMPDYSTTNLQVEGVDESDFVKTDGRFIYVVQEDQIQVLDVRSAVPATAGTIRPDMDEDTDRICEMYVADQLLTVIIQTEKTSLQQEEGQKDVPGKNEQEAGETPKEASVQDAERQRVLKLAGEDLDVRYLDTAPVTKVVTYDLSDPVHPALKDTAVQDGWYQTSRKIGNRLYLFTDQSLGIADDLLREDAVSDDVLKQWLPAVNGSVVRADCIYLQKRGSQGILMASIDLAGHSRILDTKLLVNQCASLYVSSRSVYLYDSEYVNGALRTRIARFALEDDGTIQAVAAKTVKGSIEDTFAIHENGKYLQVLTSVTSTETWENRVYVLDENMQTTGKLTGLAKGEQIYAARFTGDIGYFVTYRNTDPLFTVDFSDPQKPEIIGELKVTGFSEYLHFWSDDRLLGIGYETNPDNGEVTGVKLSMFDISDPLNVKEEAKLVLHGVEDCEGMYDYKSVLVSAQKNVIAFTTKTYRDMYREDYRVLSYKQGKFVSRIERTLANGTWTDRKYWRSIYTGDRLYLVSEKKLLAFEMGQGWNEIGKLFYGWVGHGKEEQVVECE